MLRAAIERASTTKTAQRSKMDVLFGREPMDRGPILNTACCSRRPAIKQFLGDADRMDGYVRCMASRNGTT
ncbi:MAG: hypothetical protein U0074_08485 [Kouleothrix sp.]